jgi:hypothetical protein
VPYAVGTFGVGMLGVSQLIELRAPRARLRSSSEPAEARGFGGSSANLIPPRPSPRGNVSVGSDTAMRMSAVWAAVMGRADLISQCPPEVKRDEGRRGRPAALPFLLDPDGSGRGFDDWLFAGQVALDRGGNNVGLITGRDGLGLTARRSSSST